MVSFARVQPVLSVAVHPSTSLRYARDERMNGEVEACPELVEGGTTNGRSRRMNIILRCALVRQNLTSYR